MLLFTLLCLGTFILLFWFTLRSSKESLNNNEGYFFANRTLNSTLLALTLMATQVGGGMLIGIADMSYESGWTGSFYALGQVMGLGLVFLFFIKAFQRSRWQTTPQIFEEVFQSTELRKITSALSIISLSIILIAQAVAARKLFFSLNIQSPLPFIGIWSAVVLYTAMGGFSAVVKTDAIQMSLILIGLSLIVFFIPWGESTTLIKTLSTTTKPITFNESLNYLIWPCCYMVIEQDMIQRFGSARSLNSVKKGILWAMLGICVIASVPMMLGLLAQAQGLIITPQSSVLMTVSQTLLPPYMSQIMMFILLMAIISSVDSVLCAISSLVTCDNWVKAQTSYSQKVCITLFLGFLALIGAFFAESVINTLVFSYGLTASALFVPVMCALLNLPTRKACAVIAVVTGCMSYIGLSLLAPEWAFLALGMSAVGFALGFLWPQTNVSMERG